MHKKSQKGFSLIELLIAISIIVILTSVFLANFYGRNQSRAVNITTNNLVSDLHKMQSFSISTRDIASGSTASQYGAVLIANSGSYTLVGYNSNQPPVPTTIGTVNIPPNVQISALTVTKVDGTIATPATLNVFFTAPFGKVLQSYPGSASNEVNDVAKIKITSTDNSVCSYVSINGITGNITTQSNCP